MSAITVYHNPKCSKSRATLELVEQHGDDLKVIEYLRTPPSAKELDALLAKLGLEPEQLVRKGEDVYKKDYAGKTLSRAQWIEAMVRHPVLIERPIVVAGDRAVIGRPPENVLTLLDGRR
ncbi:MAG TPA: arsenate reductase (glutaredoxin) [Gammaproteobacteria bacterium]|nr:arsenate reductase (glutaredoxin) [Gammaproteobacteria bacterium]